MTFALALEACYKVATRQLVFIVNPCHLLCVIHIILLAVPAKHKSLQYLFRYAIANYFSEVVWKGC